MKIKMFYIPLVLCFSFYSSIASTTLSKVGGTCVNPTILSFIENSLANLSMSDSLNSVTSLFQLSLLKEMVGSCKEKSCKNNNSNNETPTVRGLAAENNFSPHVRLFSISGLTVLQVIIV